MFFLFFIWLKLEEHEEMKHTACVFFVLESFQRLFARFFGECIWIMGCNGNEIRDEVNHSEYKRIKTGDTVDGSNPAPPEMYEIL